MRVRRTLALAAVGLIAACAPRPAPTPIYAEPVFDKYGNPSCRPPNVPVGGVYTADLPLCQTLQGAAGATTSSNGSAAGAVPQPPQPPQPPVGPPPEQEPTPPWRIQNQNQNTNQNTNQNRNQGG